jgi:2-polyprenyl-3-methyl-5-hydroxy-6-metoxy-1,4-benzoquinol methylase
MLNWESYYREKISRSGGIHLYFSKKAKEYSLLLRCIRAAVPAGGTVAEVGAGTGVLSCVLATEGLRCIATDIDPNMVSLIRENRDALGLNFDIICQDVRYPAIATRTLDAVFSNGLIEHFSDREIVECLNTQLRCAQSVIVSIPSRGYSTADRLFGDERFLSQEEWTELVYKSNGRLVAAEEFRVTTSNSGDSDKWFLVLEIQ